MPHTKIKMDRNGFSSPFLFVKASLSELNEPMFFCSIFKCSIEASSSEFTVIVDAKSQKQQGQNQGNLRDLKQEKIRFWLFESAGGVKR